MKPKITVLRSHAQIEGNPTGGAQFLRDTIEVLKDDFTIEVRHLYNPKSNTNRAFRLLSFIKFVLQMKFMHFPSDIIIMDRKSLAFKSLQKDSLNIGIVHHYDPNGTKNQFKKRLLQKTTHKGIKHADVLVTVSNYWKECYLNMGYPKVETIYNAYDLPPISLAEITKFKADKFADANTPIIYIGKYAPGKGVEETYHALKNEGYTLVSTGKNQPEFETRHFFLPYKEFLMLLACCDASIHMSSMPEGWCRTAHESLLMRTPVIGSGIAGMSELIKESKQTICHDPSKLPNLLNQLLTDKTKYQQQIEDGYRYAAKFDREMFKNAWLQLINSNLKK